MPRLLVATANRGKLDELAPVLAGFGFETVGLDAFGELPEAVEDADTFAGNARGKAEHYGRLTGLPALADDSGLEVDALDGAPGVRSARYAGPAQDATANLARLIEAMEAHDDRRARFRCALCLVAPDDSGAQRVLVEVDGVCEGALARAPRGDGGFGYDPLFVPVEEGEAEDPSARTFAQMTREEKRVLSHRGRALAALERALTERRAAEAPP